MAKNKQWRVRPEYDGKVALQSEEKQVILSNDLGADALEALAADGSVVGFLEKIAINDTSENGKS